MPEDPIRQFIWRARVDIEKLNRERERLHRFELFAAFLGGITIGFFVAFWLMA